MNESVADDMLRNYFERWQRLEGFVAEWDSKRPHRMEARRLLASRPRRATLERRIGPRPYVKKGEGVDLAVATDMLALCQWLTKLGNAGEDEPEDRRGYTIACRLTRLGWNEVQYAIGDVSEVGAEHAAHHWAAYMSPADERVLGYVYSAFNPDAPEFVKVGFSRNPEKRMRSLSRLHGAQIVLGICIPATMLHEWTIHQTIFRPVAPEWYRASDLPDWLLPLHAKKEAA